MHGSPWRRRVSDAHATGRPASAAATPVTQHRSSAAPSDMGLGSRKRGRAGCGADGAPAEAGSSRAFQGPAVVVSAAVMPPGETFPGGVMWNPEEYYLPHGPVFRVAAAGAGGGGAGRGGRAGTSVPATLVGALPDPGAVDCREAVLRLECTLEGLNRAALVVMHAPCARAGGGRQRRVLGGKPSVKARERREGKAGARPTLTGGAARAFVFQVLSTQRVLQRLHRAVGRAVGGAQGVDMSSSWSLGAPPSCCVFWTRRVGWPHSC